MKKSKDYIKGYEDGREEGEKFDHSAYPHILKHTIPGGGCKEEDMDSAVKEFEEQKIEKIRQEQIQADIKIVEGIKSSYQPLTSELHPNTKENIIRKLRSQRSEEDKEK
ncbi:MAG TPA: hypothetical protein ENI13_00880 [candidate division CPR3 bacterium]|uniref:Uncharacterized protein n=1 Tax=candidate division CPR3 bacterium TaxID=2268181 RepID=A0A7C1SPR6_UNCC3|nr:hypothetical protein [candidate division CPR3 bacterium]